MTPGELFAWSLLNSNEMQEVLDKNRTISAFCVSFGSSSCQ